MMRPRTPLAAVFLCLAGILPCAAQTPQTGVKNRTPNDCIFCGDGGGGPTDPVEICQANCVAAFIICPSQGKTVARCDLEKAECYAKCSMNE